MTYHTHALPGGDQRRSANHQPDHRHNPPCPTSGAQCEDEAGDDTGENTKDTQAASKDNARAITVADGPADEVRVGLAP